MNDSGSIRRLTEVTYVKEHCFYSLCLTRSHSLVTERTKTRESREQFAGDNSSSWFCLSDGARLDQQLCSPD